MKFTLFGLLVLALSLLAICANAQVIISEAAQRNIDIECSEFANTELHTTCIEQSKEAYESWQHFVSDPEFEDISEIVSKCSIDWPGYIMRVECVMTETKALVRINDLVNVHGISPSLVKQALDNCASAQEMGYVILERCIREEVVSISGKPLP